MKTYIKSLTAVWHMLKNKIVALGVLFVLASVYRALPSDQPVPFAELLYAIILASSVVVLAPMLRVLVFNEAAIFAEGGGLDAALKEKGFSPALLHYWFATSICYLTSLLCVSSLLS